MKHVKLFEQFSTETGKEYATCFQGDGFVGVGILDEAQQKELQDALDRAISEYPTNIDYLRIDKVDVTGMGYVLHSVDGEFSAMPTETNPLEYAYHIKADGELDQDGTVYMDDMSRLFDLVKGKMLSIDHHSSTELLTVGEFIDMYLGY